MKNILLFIGCAGFFSGCAVSPATVEVPVITTPGIRTLQPIRKGHRGERKERHEKHRKDD